MGKIKGHIEKRPNYYHGQLLTEKDFLREQLYHIEARRRHNKAHGAGVVSGLHLTPRDNRSVLLEPGYAIDHPGNELAITAPVTIDLKDYEPNASLQIGIYYEDPDSMADGSTKSNTQDIITWITVSRSSETEQGLTIAIVQLDDKGEVGHASIDYRNRLEALKPDSVTAEQLNRRLKRGWMRLPFRPRPLVNKPKGAAEIPPPFRVSANRVLSPDSKKADEKDKGAAGTMQIPVPPGATRVTRFRIAGEENEGEIKIVLIVGGWDTDENKHYNREMLIETITSQGPFNSLYTIEDGELDSETHTLSIWLRGTRRTSVSLVAVEFVYYDEA
jgi:hypothetical protein